MPFNGPLVKLEQHPNFPWPVPVGTRVPSLKPGAKIEYQGIKYSVITWPQKQLKKPGQEVADEVTFETVRGKSAVLILPFDDERIMMVETEQPERGKYLAFIAGEIEDGESLHHACRRELLEEIGFEANEFHVVYCHEPAQNFGQEFYIYTVIAKGCRKIAEPISDAGERCTPYYIDVDDLIEETKVGKYRFPPRMVTDLLISGKVHRIPMVFHDPAKHAAITYPNKE